MAKYTTEDGICGNGGHQITDAPGVRNKGYTSPTVHRSTFGGARVRLCKAHYLEAWAARYPSEPLPELA